MGEKHMSLEQILESRMSPLRKLLEQNLPAVLFSRGIQNEYDERSIGSGLVVWFRGCRCSELIHSYDQPS